MEPKGKEMILEIPVTDIRSGMVIADKASETLNKLLGKTTEVSSVSLGESCSGIHINHTQCYNKHTGKVFTKV